MLLFVGGPAPQVLRSTTGESVDVTAAIQATGWFGREVSVLDIERLR